MPVVSHQFTTVGAAMQPGYLIALELARQCVDQYHINILLGAGGGIANASCWAAVATVPNPGVGFPAPYGVSVAGPPGVNVGAWGTLPYGMVFGNSQLANVNANVPVPGFGGGGHGERTALIAAGANGLVLYPIAGLANTAVLFVQLEPCVPCDNWLGGVVGAGVANPYAGAILGGLTVHVWYRWPYPGGVGAMTAWNAQGRVAKLADINANW